MSIYQKVSCRTDGNCCCHIQNGMLLQEHGGDGDPYCDKEKDDLPSPGRKMLAVPSGKHDCDGADHMQRREYIGVGIKLIVRRHDMREHIISLKYHRPQLLAVGKQDVDQQGEAICHDDELHHSFERSHIKQNCVNMNAEQVYKPQQVRY